MTLKQRFVMSHTQGGIQYELHGNYYNGNNLLNRSYDLLDREKEMSKQIYRIICEKCNRELANKSEGEYRNPDGTWTSNTRVLIVNRDKCPYCTKYCNKEKSHGS